MAESGSCENAQHIEGDTVPEKDTDSRKAITTQVNVPENLCDFQSFDNETETNSQGELEDVLGVEEKGAVILSEKSASEETECCSNCKGLQKKLAEEEKRCAVLRANIHKVSANWFQRKTQLSESEADSDATPVGLLDQTMRVEGDSTSSVADASTSNDSREVPSKSKDLTKLLSMIAQKTAQLEVSDSHCHDLKRRLRECEKIIDDKEDIIHGLKDQLETYLTDNQQMSLQLNNLAVLFQQLEKADQEVVSKPKKSEEEDDTAATVPLPTQDEFQEMTRSVSKTYIKLKDLIYEKKALVTEIERLNTLNVELQKRVVQQETRLMSVTDALHQTWLVVSDLKEQHAKLHDDELIMRYELKQKRNILTKLRRELESSRAQWQVIRQKNQESEEEYASIREMLRERRKETSESISEQEEHPEEPDEAVCLHPDDTKSFDPPVDLLLEMGLEYGIIGEEAEMTQTVLDVIGGEDVRHNRLEQLEEHCSLLYQKLLASTSRSLFLASRLSRLHRQFGSSDEEEDIDDFVMEAEEEDGEEEEENQEDGDDQSDDGEEGAEYYTDADRMAMMESVLSSPVSEEYDTAYVSETEAAEPQTDQRPEDEAGPLTDQSNALESDQAIAAESSDTMSSDMDESCDHLSRTLINFLPRKIEFLKKENKKLESLLKTTREEREAAEVRASALEKDKNKLEEELKILAKDITMEKLQRQQLEEQLKHLGKCVDQLKLDQRSEVAPDKEQTTPSTPSSESRGKDERRSEEEKLKKEVALLKREMEVKKKEKDLRKREEELSKKEEDLTREKGGKSDGRKEGCTRTSQVKDDQVGSRGHSDITAVISAASRIVEAKLTSEQQFSMQEYSSSLVVVPVNLDELSNIKSLVQKRTTYKDPNLGAGNSTQSLENRETSTYLLLGNTEDREQKSLSPSSLEESIAKGAVPRYRNDQRSTVKHEDNQSFPDPNDLRSKTLTFVVAPVLSSADLKNGDTSARVTLTHQSALLLPFRLEASATKSNVDTSTAVTEEALSAASGSYRAVVDTAETGAAKYTSVDVNQDSCLSAVSVRLAAKCQSIQVTAFKQVCSTSQSPPSSGLCDASVVMPVVRVMKDESINITITAHSQTVTTILITSYHPRDEAIVEYGIRKVEA